MGHEPVVTLFCWHNRGQCRVLSQNELSAIFDIFKVRTSSYNTKLYLSNDTFLIIYKGMFLKLWYKVLNIFLLFSLYFSSLNLKYLNLTKMELTRFAMKLFVYIYIKDSRSDHDSTVYSVYTIVIYEYSLEYIEGSHKILNRYLPCLLFKYG